MTTNDRKSRIAALKAALKERILVLDGAMGTALQAKNLTVTDFGGEEFEGCNEHLVLTRPDVIASVHRSYLEAGADIIETNTFGSTALVLAEYPPLNEQAQLITRRAAEIARAEADALTTTAKPRFVAGSMGPTTKALSVTGGVTFDELIRQFREQAVALVEGGADFLLLETAQDTRNIKAGILGIEQASAELGFSVPVAVSGTIEPMGTMLAGQTAEALVVSLAHLDLLYIGLNCATGPEFMTDHIRAISELAKTHVACVPNAGLPDEDGRYLETPELMARVLDRFIGHGWVNLIGGCCGTTAAHIARFADLVQGKAPRPIPRYTRTLVSGLEVVEVADDNRPIIVGERTNSLGSRAFKQLIADEKFEEASEIARKQVRGGAHVIDVCLQNPDRNELADVERFLSFAIQKVKVPLMIDSTDARVIERALTYCQGKAIINSINLEDGLERFETVVPLAKRYGAALIVGCIDEDKQQGMAVTRARKLAVAQRSLEILQRDFRVDPSDIIFDPLVFPCATGDANYLGSARETVEGIRLIKAAFPACKTILGISNVSFGLPAGGREIVNSVFLYHCTKAGLDMAIVNSEKLERYASIPQDERELAEAVLFETSDAIIAQFTERFRAVRKVKAAAAQLPLDERLAQYIVTGSKDGLIDDLDEKLKTTKPLDIINGPLMKGMDEVGRLFNANELIVAEVLQSAEAMKAAVSHLQQFMEKSDTAVRGKLLLATVKGDVHDIGKNLVDIVLSNNGYQVINLGIKVQPQDLIRAVEEHRPDMIGLSGLLVKSAQQMVVTAEELAQHAINVPLLVGGAALSRNFTRNRIAPAYGSLTLYAQDAMDGLALANQLMSEAGRVELERRVADEVRAIGANAVRQMRSSAAPETRSPRVELVSPLPVAPDFARHVLRELPLDEVWAYINPKMLYGRHLGLRGDLEKLLKGTDARAQEKAEALFALIEELKKVSRPGGPEPMRASAVWQFYPVSSQGNTLLIHDPNKPEAVLQRWAFPRQPDDEGLCLADYAQPHVEGQPARDSAALFVVTAGEGIRERYEHYKAAGEYLRSHAVQALALETAEAAAEWLHRKLRGLWGFPDAPELTMLERFQARYRGKRFSFGYPACPELGMQAPLFELLRPGEVGITLTEEFMMEPEASVSALVFHHPQAKYFSVGKDQNA